MKICGIISEYNPFHSGHKYQIEQTRSILGNDCVIVAIMSGNYVQRGDFAITEKYTRAKMAILGGADLAIELPLCSALSSAEGFALGAIEVLNAMGCVDYLSFGSESGNIDDLYEIAKILIDEDFSEIVKNYKDKNNSYATIVQSILSHKCPEKSELLKYPNNTLGIEYIKALLKTNSKIQPISIKRIGTGHDQIDDFKETASASQLRNYVSKNTPQFCKSFMPPLVYNEFIKSLDKNGGPATFTSCEKLMMSHFRRLDNHYFSLIPDASEGLGNRLCSALKECVNLHDGMMLAKSKRYTFSRIRRMTMCAYLGITQELANINLSYIRVLAFNDHGRNVLKTMKNTCTVPVITKPLDAKKLFGEAKRLIDLDDLADDLYYLSVPNPLSGGSSYKMTPFYKK